MRPKLFFTFILAFFAITTQLKAQSVINSSATVLSNNGFIVEYSIGEIVVPTNTTNQTILTQSLPQPNIKLNNPECDIINAQLYTFPNPVKDKIYIVTQQNWISGYVIYSSAGLAVKSHTYFNNFIDLSELASGIYFIKFLPGCNNIFRTIKVLKQ